MLSLACLLNPAPSGPSPLTPRYQPSPALSSPGSAHNEVCPSSFEARPVPSSKAAKMANDNRVFSKPQVKGTVNFPAFENVDTTSLREIERYQIHPFGKIQQHFRHIPYNSGKKDFYDKTGRESFEVFQYMFKVEGDDSDYTIMWDYNVGLVRMTPFFKCCKYSKTVPAKMLNMNPGLRDITHSITGGSIMAQGYWMPYACAKAVCATFCAPIAGALIPIFGPDFPSLCIPLGSPEHGRMTINPAIVAESTREAEMFRRTYVKSHAVSTNSHLPHHHHHHHQHHHQHQHQHHRETQHYSHGPALPSPTSIPSPQPAHHGKHGARRPGVSPYEHKRDGVDVNGCMRLKRVLDSQDDADSDSDVRSATETPSLQQVFCPGIPASPMSPPRSSGWTVVNQPARPRHSSPSSSSLCHRGCREGISSYSSSPNPVLSAIPRFCDPARVDHYQKWQQLQLPFKPATTGTADADCDRQGRNCPTKAITARGTTATTASRPPPGEGDESHHPSCFTTTTTGVDKNAALLLMNMSVRDYRDAKGAQRDAMMAGDGTGSKEKLRERVWSRRRPIQGLGPEPMPMSPDSSRAPGHRSKRRRATSM